MFVRFGTNCYFIRETGGFGALRYRRQATVNERTERNLAKVVTMIRALSLQS